MTDGTMTYDAIDNLAGLGYSEREAAFFYMVAVHSGYFLRRQFNQFVARERGAIATSFLSKALDLGHIHSLPCAEGRFIYHLAGKKLYRILGQQESQSRRVKSQRDILRRLITLDYVLLHVANERFVETPQARHELFERMAVPANALQSAEAFGQSFPISCAEAEGQLTIRFGFINEGQRSSAMFARFLRCHGGLLRALPRAEVFYVATSPTPFAQAAYVFERQMPLRNSGNLACPRGVEHLIRWLDARQQVHERSSPIDWELQRLSLEGECLYTAPVHQALIVSWKNGAMNPEKIRKMFPVETHRTSLTTELMTADYPNSRPDRGLLHGLRPNTERLVRQ